MPNEFGFPFEVDFDNDDNVGLSQGVQVNKEDVYKVYDINSPELVTTSGRMGVTTLDETSDYIINNMGGRTSDYIITLRGDAVRVVNPDDSISTPVLPG